DVIAELHVFDAINHRSGWKASDLAHKLPAVIVCSHGSIGSGALLQVVADQGEPGDRGGGVDVPRRRILQTGYVAIGGARLIDVELVSVSEINRVIARGDVGDHANRAAVNIGEENQVAGPEPGHVRQSDLRARRSNRHRRAQVEGAIN